MNRMNAIGPATLAAVTSPAPRPEAAYPTTDERLCHLFRATLRNGRIHPLYLPMLKYRQGRPQGAAA